MNDQDIEQEIQAKGLAAPRVTPADIKALMDRIVYTFDVRPNGSTTTLAHAFLDGKFYLATGASACVSVENFDAELGKDIAMKGAKAAAEDKLWELEGYALWKRLGEPLLESIRALSQAFKAKTAPEQWLMDQLAALLKASERPTEHSVSCLYQYALARLGLVDTPQLRALFWDAHDALVWEVESDSYRIPEIHGCEVCETNRQLNKEQ